MYNNSKERRKEKEKRSLLEYLMSFPAFIWSSQFAAKQLGVIFPSRQKQSVRRHLETKNAFVNATTMSHQEMRLLIKYGGLTLCLIKRLLCFNGGCSVNELNASRLGMSVLSRHHLLPNSSATCVATLAAHSRYVRSVAFHPTAPLLATGSDDDTVKLWRLSSDNSSATCVATLAAHSGSVFSVAFHPTAPLLATGSWDSTVKLWL